MSCLCDTCKHEGRCEYGGGSCPGYEPKVVTNGDRIRSMSDEELAAIIMCPHDPPLTGCEDWDSTNCVAYCLDWLKLPAEVE